MAKVVILGGGISGLTSAYHLAKTKGLSIGKILLLESTNHLGGWIQTSQYDDGSVFEHGPRSIRAAGKVGINTLQMVEELGLEDSIVAISKSHPGTRNRFIFAKNRLCLLPNAPSAVFRKLPPFSRPLAAIGWKEPFRKSVRLQDETVYDFFRRRFSTELAEYAADPLCRGIYAGDCRKLSIKSCFPDVFRAEQEHGSVIRGMLKAKKDKTTYSGLVGRMKEESWAIWTLEKGLVQLPEAIGAHLKKDSRVQIHTNSPCEKLDFVGNKIQVHYNGKVEEADHIISSVQAKYLAPLLEPQHQQLSEQLCQLPAVTVGVVSLEYEDTQLPYEGFGHLVPSSEPSKALGVIYESSIFREHDRKDNRAIRLTSMMGGAWFEDYFGSPENCDLDHLKDVAIATMNDQLQITKQPSRAIVRLQKDCITQYTLGHSDRVDQISAYIDEHDLPLSLVGSSYRGVSVNDCIYNAKVEAERLGSHLDTHT